MGEAVAWVARIAMTEESYQKLLRCDAAYHFAEAIEVTLSGGHRNYYVFKYNKKDSSVTLLAYLEKSKPSALEGARVWIPFEELVLYSEKGRAGYIAGFTGAEVPDQDNIVTAYRVADNSSEEVSRIPEAEWTRIIKGAAAIYNKGAGGKEFAEDFFQGAVVDPYLVAICRRLAESRHLENVRPLLQTASFKNPVHLFDRYYYNGSMLYYVKDKISFIPPVDINTLVRTDYGAADSSFAVCNGIAYRCDPNVFDPPEDPVINSPQHHEYSLSVPDGMVYPPEYSKKSNKDAYYKSFLEWDSDHFEKSFATVDGRVDAALLSRISSFLFVCGELNRFDEIIDYCKKIEEYMWIDPSAFFYLACAYSVKEDYERALESIHNAIVYGYDHCGKIFLDKRMIVLHKNKKFSEYRKYYNSHANEMASPELLQKVLSVSPKTLNFKRYATRLAFRTRFFDVPQLERIAEKTNDERYKSGYIEMQRRFFDEYFLLDEQDYDYSPLYSFYGKYESVHPKAHYLALCFAFKKVHLNDGRIDSGRMEDVLDMAKNLRESLRNDRYVHRNSEMVNEYSKDFFFNYILSL